MTDRLKESFDDLIGRMEEPPAWETITTHQLRPTQPASPGRRWMAFATGVATVAVVGVLGSLLVDQGRLAANAVPYVQIDWTQQVEMRCQGMDIEDNGGFDSASIEIWGPTSDNVYRLDATAPDGTVERQILEMGADNRPIRAWYSLPLVDSADETVFRVSGCAGTGPDETSHYSMAQPPLFPMVLSYWEFFDLPVALSNQEPSSSDLIELLTSRFDDQRADEWKEQPITVFSRNSFGVDELGSLNLRDELWVDLKSLRAERHVSETDSEVLGRLIVTTEVTDRAEVAPEDVSFDPTGLHEIFDRSEIDEQGVVTTTSIIPTAHPLMENAVEIRVEAIPTPELKQAISPVEGDQLYSVPVDDFEVLVRLRAGNRPHIYATSCDVLALVDLPDGWDGTCLERTVDGQRQPGTFPYGTTSR